MTRYLVLLRSSNGGICMVADRIEAENRIEAIRQWLIGHNGDNTMKPIKRYLNIGVNELSWDYNELQYYTHLRFNMCLSILPMSTVLGVMQQ